jgi:hypothetical protein
MSPVRSQLLFNSDWHGLRVMPTVGQELPTVANLRGEPKSAFYKMLDSTLRLRIPPKQMRSISEFGYLRLKKLLRRTMTP